MDFLELRYEGKTYTTKNHILEVLSKEKLYWLIDSEVNKAIIEIQNNTVIWHEGIYM